MLLSNYGSLRPHRPVTHFKNCFRNSTMFLSSVLNILHNLNWFTPQNEGGQAHLRVGFSIYNGGRTEPYRNCGLSRKRPVTIKPTQNVQLCYSSDTQYTTLIIVAHRAIIRQFGALDRPLGTFPQCARHALLQD